MSVRYEPRFTIMSWECVTLKHAACGIDGYPACPCECHNTEAE